MSPFVIVLNVLECAAAITGFIYWQKIRQSYWRWFPVYLMIIALSEIAGEYMSYVKNNAKANIAIYSYWVIPLEFLFFYWLFYQFFNKSSFKKWAVYAAIIYLLFWFSDIFSWPPFLYSNEVTKLFDSFSYSVGNLLLLILLLIFFIMFTKSDAILNYKDSIMFWVCLGLLIFYLGSMPFYGIHSTLSENYYDFFLVYWRIQFILNYIMYSLFIIAFVWGKSK